MVDDLLRGDCEFFLFRFGMQIVDDEEATYLGCVDGQIVAIVPRNVFVRITYPLYASMVKCA